MTFPKFIEHSERITKQSKRREKPAHRSHDTNALPDLLESRKIEAVIPPKRNRKVQRAHDKDIYKLRHIIENTFLKFKA